MANARHQRSLGRRSQEQPASKAAQPRTRDKQAFVSNRVKWALAGMLLGAAAGWMVFRAFLTLVTLD